MRLLWTYRYYVDEAGGGSDVRKSYDDGSKELQGRFFSKLRFLAQLPADEWREPHAKLLKGDCAGLYEIRFKADKTQQRPLGFRSGVDEFTIVFWAKEKGGKWVPLSACDQAQKRKQAILTKTGMTDVLWLSIQ